MNTGASCTFYIKGLRFSMHHFSVLYITEDLSDPLDKPFGFNCWAEDSEHAKEQCLNAYPYAQVVWVWTGPEEDAYYHALEHYYEFSPGISE